MYMYKTLSILLIAAVILVQGGFPVRAQQSMPADTVNQQPMTDSGAGTTTATDSRTADWLWLFLLMRDRRTDTYDSYEYRDQGSLAGVKGGKARTKADTDEEGEIL
jgi:hypothetical protein